MNGAARMLTLAWMVCFASPAAGQFARPEWEEQPEELREIYLEMRELGEKCRFGLKRIEDPAFVQRVMECKRRLDLYTREHEGKALNEFYWGTAFWNIYRFAGTQWAEEYHAAEKILRDGFEVLSETRAEDPAVVPSVMLHMYVSHVHSWVESNPFDCARVWDEAGEWVRETDMARLTRTWQLRRSSLETRLLYCVAKLPDTGRGPLVAERVRIMEQYISDESVPMRRRSIALRGLTEHLAKTGESSKNSRLMEGLKDKTEATPDYWYSRMLVALFGEGDWEKATETLDMVNKFTGNGPVKPSDRRMHEQTLDLYYGHIFLPGIELRRRGGAGIMK